MMINEKINDRHTVAEWETWREKKYPKGVNRENIKCVWWIWDVEDGDVWDKEYAYRFEHANPPHADPTYSCYAEWMVQDFININWCDWDSPERVTLYVEDELGRRYKIDVHAEETVEFNTYESKMKMEEAWPKEDEDG